jgi:hypothetical protein
MRLQQAQAAQMQQAQQAQHLQQQQQHLQQMLETSQRLQQQQLQHQAAQQHLQHHQTPQAQQQQLPQQQMQGPGPQHMQSPALGMHGIQAHAMSPQITNVSSPIVNQAALGRSPSTSRQNPVPTPPQNVAVPMQTQGQQVPNVKALLDTFPKLLQLKREGRLQPEQEKLVGVSPAT